ncbi:unannotated protein [freshwater metagenome]|uniref:Unannotated protein n=1 Tax=freshwater metagenome TaxID=449393 RepID=A0A6J6XWE5_9ZZZZ
MFVTSNIVQRFPRHSTRKRTVTNDSHYMALTEFTGELPGFSQSVGVT